MLGRAQRELFMACMLRQRTSQSAAYGFDLPGTVSVVRSIEQFDVEAG